MRSILFIALFSCMSISLNAQTNNTSNASESLGGGALMSITFGDYNVAIGDSAGTNLTSGSNNTFVGEAAGYSQTTASDNTLIGQDAGRTLTTGTDNTFVGKQSGRLATGTDNTLIGCEAGLDITTGSDNTFVGEESGENVTTGRDNTFVGEDSGTGITTGVYNVAVGNQTLGNGAYLTPNSGEGSAYRNVALGYYALSDVGNAYGDANYTVHHCTAVGDSAGVDNGTGSYNTYLGAAAGACNEFGEFNTFGGAYAGWENGRLNNDNEANGNTMFGFAAGYENRRGSDNVVIGRNSDFQSVGTNSSDNSDNVLIGAWSLLRTNVSLSVGIGSYIDIFHDNSIGIGYNAQIDGLNSIGIGYNTSVNNSDYSVAIGSGSSVTSANSMVLGGTTATDRVSVGIGTTAPNQNASLDLAEADHGFLISRMTAGEQTTFEAGLGLTDEGMMIYNTDEDKVKTWDGTQWIVTGVQDLDLTGNDLTITDGATTVDLSAYLDNTDAQNLSLTGNTLNIDNGTGVDLSMYLDDTDTQLTEAQVDAFVANNGYLTSFSEVDGDITNEIQDISLSGTDLTLSSGSTIDLSVIDTDTQIDSTGIAGLGFVAGPHTVDTDQQNLTGANLTGTTLQIDIENGNSVSVDLAPLLTDLQLQIDDLETRLTILEGCACDSTNGLWDPGANDFESAILYQNVPNPFNNTSSIKYYIPSSANSANLVFSNDMGQVVSNIELHEVGAYGEAHINAADLPAGTYMYTLYIDQARFETKKMIVQ